MAAHRVDHQSGRRHVPARPRPAGRLARVAIVRSGLSVQGGVDALAAAEQIRTVLDVRPELLTSELWPTLQRLFLTLATGVHEVQRRIRQKKVASPALIPLATDWIAGLPAADLHQKHHGDLLTPDITATTSAIDKLIVQDLARVVSAVFQLLELLSMAATTDTPMDLSYLPFRPRSIRPALRPSPASRR
ncbi:hypothetical protein [Streptomyces sp. NPDC059134]|uniref:hypothetical protein n=1 Tax=Streptomyces sp. NPDC059134 TaxID=3346738 RepID=UPI0036A637C8